MKAITPKTYLALLVLVSITWPRAVPAQQMLVVRIINPHRFPVRVHSGIFNAYGYRQWVPVTAIAPQSYVDIPNVPVGALLGVDNPEMRRAWPPFNVFFASPYLPHFVYQVPP